MADSNQKEHTVRIHIQQGSRCKVTPAKLHVELGDVVNFDNGTDTAVTLWFPEAKPFGVGFVPVPDDTPVQKTVQGIPNPTAPEEFPFAPFCYGKRKFAEGDSMPIIIVDPKQ